MNLEIEKSLIDEYQKLKPSLMKIYFSFRYIGLKEEEFADICKKIIQEIQENDQSTENYEKEIEKKVKIKLSNIARKMLNNPNTAIDMIDSYINCKFKKTLDYETSLTYFKKLDAFLETYDYVLTPDLLVELIQKNKIYNKMLEIIFKQKENLIKSNNADTILDNNLFLSSIESYCELNHIEITIKEDDIEDFNDFFCDDSTKMYLKEIGEKELLTREEERELFERLANSDKLARQIIIERNLKLVVSIARKFQNNGLPLLDLIEEGNIGLIKAVDKFDYKRGNKFSTYATWWIKQNITRAIADKGRNVRVPVHLYEKIKRYKRTVTELENKLGRTPTINELANEMGLSIPQVANLDKLELDTISTNLIVGEKEDKELEDFLPSMSETPEEIMIVKNLKTEVRSLLEKCNLKPKEMDVLTLRIGLTGEEPMKLAEVGEIMHLTRERVRQLEANGFVKLIRSKYIKDLAVYSSYPNQALQRIEELRKKYSDPENRYKKFLQNDSKDKKKEKEREEEMSKLQTIYEYFKIYTREQVDEMLTKLTEEDRNLIAIRYGSDLDHPVSSKLTKEEEGKFYGYLVPKMKRLLANPNKIRKPRKKKQGEQNSLSMPKEESFTCLPSIQEDIKEKVEEEPLVATNNEEEISSNEIERKENYIKLLELLKTPTFGQMMTTLSVKDAVILSLKLGYIDGKYFSTESIAKFLQIEEDEVREVIKKVLLLYKENINHVIDQAIEMSTEKSDETLIRKI